MIDLVAASDFCTLKRGCMVNSHDLRDDGMTIHYKDPSGPSKSVECRYLIGADGKKGIVRKHFLEPSACIKMREGIYKYEGTWVAANLHIRLPTPDTHPDFPLWKLGFTPERLYDLFWPKGWHFCNPPGKATACGRFGPYEDRMWRQEFAQEDWDDSMDSVGLFWEHVTPMITRSCDEQGVPFPEGPVMFPQDCVEIRRCRPFNFSHRVVDRWFDKGRILIGDAAHVFPPFGKIPLGVFLTCAYANQTQQSIGGEGIASGIRDAHQLAWRLALMIPSTVSSQNGPMMEERLLTAWAAERRRGIDRAAIATKANGKMCNEPESWGFFFFRQSLPLLKKLPFVTLPPDPRAVAEAKGFKGTEGGFFLPEFGGAGKLAQVFVETAETAGGGVRLSDEMLKHRDGAILTLLVVGGDRVGEAKALLKDAELPPSILSEESIIVLNDENLSQQSQRHEDGTPVFFRTTTPTTNSAAGLNVPPAYNEHSYLARLSKPKPLFAILRPDFYIFALLPSAEDLAQALQRLKEMLSLAQS